MNLIVIRLCIPVALDLPFLRAALRTLRLKRVMKRRFMVTGACYCSVLNEYGCVVGREWMRGKRLGRTPCNPYECYVHDIYR